MLNYLSRNLWGLCWALLLLPFANPSVAQPCIITGDQSPCTNVSVTYTHNFVGGTTFNWSAQNGSILSQDDNNASVQVQWNMPGNGTLFLDILDANGMLISECSLTVEPLPQPPAIIEFETPPLNNDVSLRFCFGEAINVVNNNNYTWTDGDGNIIQLPYTPPTEGEYTLCLTETDNNGCEATNCVQYTVLKAPDSSFDLIGYPEDQTAVVCNLAELYFANLVDPPTPGVESTPYSFYWTIFEGATLVHSSDNYDLIYLFDTPGTYTVTLQSMLSVGCLSEPFSMDVQVLEALAPQIECPSIICEGSTITYSTNADCGTFQWGAYYGDANPIPGMADGNTFTVNWENLPPDFSGLGYITLTVSNCTGGYCEDNETVLPIPIIPTTIDISGPQNICASDDEPITYSAPFFPNATYTWTTTPSNLGNQVNNNPNVFVIPANSAPESFEVCLQIDHFLADCSASGCMTTDFLTLNIDGPGTVCLNDATNFSVVPVLPAGYTTAWTFEHESGTNNFVLQGDASGVAVPSGSLSEAGNYIITVAITDGQGNTFSCSDSYLLEVRDEIDPPQEIFGPTMICLNEDYIYSVDDPDDGITTYWEVTGGFFPGGVTTNYGTIVEVTWFNAGTLTAYYEYADAPICRSEGHSIDVVNTTQAPQVEIVGPEVVCADEITDYSLDIAEAENITWTLSPEDAGVILPGANEGEVMIKWSAAGPENITLSASGNAGQCNTGFSTFTFIQLITPPPIVLEAAPNTGCLDEIYTFTVLNDPADTYRWTIDGVEQNMVTPAIDFIFTEPGRHYIRVEALGVAGCQTIVMANTFVDVLPDRQPLISAPLGIICNDAGEQELPPGSFLMVEDWDNSLYDYDYSWQQNVNGSWFPVGTNDPILMVNEIAEYRILINQVGTNCTYETTYQFETCGVSDCSCDITGDATIEEVILSPNGQCGTFDFSGTLTPDFSLFENISWSIENAAPPTNIPVVTENDLIQTTIPLTNAGFYNLELGANLNCPNGRSCVVKDRVQIFVPVVAEFNHYFECGGGDDLTLNLEDLSEHAPADENMNQIDITNVTWGITGLGSIGSGEEASFTVPGALKGTQQEVCIRVTLNTGYTCETCRVIEIPNDPVIDFEAEPQPNCEDQVLNFLPTVNTNNFVAFEWVFEPNITSGQETQVHLFEEAGNYNVSLTVEDNFGCINTVENTINAQAAPVGTVVVESAFCDTRARLTLQETSGGPFSNIQWSTGENGSTIVVDQEGFYEVTYESPNGCAATTVAAIEGLRNYQVELIGDEAFCYPASTKIDLSATGYNPFFTANWSVTPAPPYPQNPSNNGNFWTYEVEVDPPAGNQPEVYTVTLEITEDGDVCAMEEIEVTVNPSPDLFDIAQDLNSCEPYEVDLSVALEPDETAVWYRSLVPVSEGNSLITSQPGSYNAIITNSYGCQTLDNAIVPSFNLDRILSGCYEVCYEDFCEEPGICLFGYGWYDSWEWLSLDVNDPSAPPTVVASGSGLVQDLCLEDQSPGIYVLEGTYDFDDGGACSQQSKPVKLEPEVCDTIEPYDCTLPNVIRVDDDQIPLPPDVFDIYDQFDILNLPFYITPSGCEVTSYDVTIEMKLTFAAPLMDSEDVIPGEIEYEGTLQGSGTCLPYVESWPWDNTDNQLPDIEVGINFEQDVMNWPFWEDILDNYSYEYTIILENNCGYFCKRLYNSPTFNYQLLPPNESSNRSSGGKKIKNNHLHLSPIPSRDWVNVDYEARSWGELLVRNTSGALIKTVELEDAQGTLRLDVSDLPPGVYVVTLQDEQGIVETKRMMVMR